MGVCEGNPRSVLPDHMGRADYHGASINQAARFMDAGGSRSIDMDLVDSVEYITPGSPWWKGSWMHADAVGEMRLFI